MGELVLLVACERPRVVAVQLDQVVEQVLGRRRRRRQGRYHELLAGQRGAGRAVLGQLGGRGRRLRQVRLLPGRAEREDGNEETKRNKWRILGRR